MLSFTDRKVTSLNCKIEIEDVVLLAVKEYITEMAVQVLIENFTYIHNKKSLKIPKG
jgi:hypothetical protein